MTKYSCIIIEDEPLALERTKNFVNKIPNLVLLDTFEDSLEGSGFLQQNNIDILFLDIKMDELTGVELLENSKVDCQVIITTAYPEYALKGYELNITDYLLKPFDFNRFLKSVNKACDNIQKYRAEDSPNYLFIKTENRLEKVFLEDIMFIVGMRDYRRIHTQTKRIMTLQNFKELEKIIPRTLICRVHKSYMVAINKIDFIERNRIRIGQQIIPISATYKPSFFDLIGRTET